MSKSKHTRTSEDLDKKLDAFEHDTGIWPIGRDQAMVMAADESKEDIRWKAWGYWQKQQHAHEDLLAACKHASDALFEAAKQFMHAIASAQPK